MKHLRHLAVSDHVNLKEQEEQQRRLSGGVRPLGFSFFSIFLVHFLIFQVFFFFFHFPVFLFTCVSFHFSCVSFHFFEGSG